MYTTIKTLWGKTKNKSYIARATDHDWKTIDKTVKDIELGKEYPVKKQHPRILDSYKEKVIEWLEQGLNRRRIFEELVAQGVNIKYTDIDKGRKMFPVEIQKLLRQGESETIEYKETFDKETLETAVAFANTKRGNILVGCFDNGNVKGVQIGKDTINNYINQISQSSEPRVIPEVEQYVKDSKNIVVLRVKEFPIKLVSIKGKCLKRVRKSNRIMTPQEVAQMHLHSTGTSWDLFPAQNTSVKDINTKKVIQYMEMANATGRRKTDNNNSVNVLEKLNLLKDGHPTIASILLFGKEPQGKFLQAAVHCGRFKQDTIILDDKMIGGTVIEQVEEVMDFIRKNTNVRFEITGKSKREEIWDYPLEALREAVINAICHRNYADNSEIQLKIYDDKLTLWNPGGLPLGMTLKELYNPLHTSKPRNKLIAQIFYDLEFIEKYGTGYSKDYWIL